MQNATNGWALFEQTLLVYHIHLKQLQILYCTTTDFMLVADCLGGGQNTSSEAGDRDGPAAAEPSLLVHLSPEGVGYTHPCVL